jgi:thiol-disulfide isomerase/thioredoxin
MKHRSHTWPNPCTSRNLILGCIVALLSSIWLPLNAQTTAAPKTSGAPNSDALPFLREVFDLYAHATSYQLESIEEHTVTGPFSRLWLKSLISASAEPGDRFHFEVHSDRGAALQISDGKTEWIYSPTYQQYIQRAVTDASLTTAAHASSTPGVEFLVSARRLLKTFSGFDEAVRIAAYAPDETIDLNGQSVNCKVIKAEGEFPQTPEHIATHFTFWIDGQTKLIRKMTEHRQGHFNDMVPDLEFVLERQMLFPVTDLHAAPSSAQAFTFNPPPTASLVEKIEDPLRSAGHQLVGKQVPDVTFKTIGGKDVSLKSLQGKPVLLDFWATWCPPCVESLPDLAKLNHETAKNGLVLLSIDQDEEPKTAQEFWTNHNEPWPNLHGTADLLGRFPKHGIPYFVLIDSSGQVVYSAAGFDETALRAALSKLSPAFSQIAKIPAQ